MPNLKPQPPRDPNVGFQITTQANFDQIGWWIQMDLTRGFKVVSPHLAQWLSVWAFGARIPRARSALQIWSHDSLMWRLKMFH